MRSNNDFLVSNRIEIIGSRQQTTSPPGLRRVKRCYQRQSVPYDARYHTRKNRRLSVCISVAISLRSEMYFINGKNAFFLLMPKNIIASLFDGRNDDRGLPGYEVESMSPINANFPVRVGDFEHQNAMVSMLFLPFFFANFYLIVNVVT